MSYRRIRCERDGPVLVVHVGEDGFSPTQPGERSTNPEIKQDLVNLGQSISCPVVLDMSAVRSLAVDGFGILIQFEKLMSAARHPLAVCVNDDIWQLFRVTRLDQKIRRSADVITAARELTCETQDEPPQQVD